MTKIINSADQNFENDFNNLLTMNRSSDSDVTQTVAAIIDDIRKNGDEALLKYTHQFDKNNLDINNILLEEDEMKGNHVTCRVIFVMRLKYQWIVFALIMKNNYQMI